MARLRSLRLVSTDKFVAADDAIRFEATRATDYGVAWVYDASALRSGKVTDHVTGLLSSTPHPEGGTTWGIGRPGRRLPSGGAGRNRGPRALGRRRADHQRCHG